MSRHRTLARCAVVGLLLGCSDNPAGVEDHLAGRATSPAATITDTDVAGFTFLPPLAPATATTGVFDPSQSPTVEVCELTDNICSRTVVAYGSSSNASVEIRVVPEEGHYIVNWDTDASEIDPQKGYRITVSSRGWRLASRDVWFRLKDGNVGATQSAGPVFQIGRTIPIKFRIQQGAVPTLPLAGSLTSVGGNLHVNALDGVAVTVPDGRGELVQYLATRDESGVPIRLTGIRHFAADKPEKADVAVFNASGLPSHVALRDGAAVHFAYGAGGRVELQVTLPDGTNAATEFTLTAATPAVSARRGPSALLFGSSGGARTSAVTAASSGLQVHLLAVGAPTATSSGVSIGGVWFSGGASSSFEASPGGAPGYFVATIPNAPSSPAAQSVKAGCSGIADFIDEVCFAIGEAAPNPISFVRLASAACLSLATTGPVGPALVAACIKAVAVIGVTCSIEAAAGLTVGKAVCAAVVQAVDPYASSSDPLKIDAIVTIRGCGALPLVGTFSPAQVASGTGLILSVVLPSDCPKPPLDRDNETPPDPNDPDGLTRSGFDPVAPITDPTDPRSPLNPTTPAPRVGLPPDWPGDESWSLGDPQFFVPSAVAGPQGAGGRFDFHARGDYVLLKSLQPGDDLEVHGRFEFPYSTAGSGTGTVAVAARIHGDVIRIHRPEAIVPGFFYRLGFEVEIEDEVISVGSSFTRQLPGGGIVVATQSAVRLIWRDGTELRFEPLGVRVKLATARFGQVEGILGRGLVAKDGRVAQSVADLYSFYRDGWRVPLSSPLALFRRGPDPFDSRFPYAVPDISKVSATARAEAEAACRNAGVQSALILASCVFDYFATGDPQIVSSYAQFDPEIPSIDLSPAASYVRVGDAVELTARILGTADQNVTWSATGGTLTGTTAVSRTFRALVPGEYVVSASLGDLRSEARVIASAEGAGAYWRFEPSNPLRDEFGSAMLTPAGSPAPSAVPLPTPGPGSAFPSSIASLPNQGATTVSGGRYTTAIPVSATFTIEAFVHFRTLSGTFGKAIAGYTADANTAPWVFQVRLDGLAGTQRNELMLNGGYGVGATPWVAASGIVLQTGRDYHLAASFGATGQVTFYATDLTAGTPTVVRTVELGPVTVASNPSTFAIGDSFLGDFDFEIDAVIDEVRLTPRVLGPQELLSPRR